MASALHSTHKSKEASFQVVVQCQTLCPQSSPSKQNKTKQHAATAQMQSAWGNEANHIQPR